MLQQKCSFWGPTHALYVNRTVEGFVFSLLIALRKQRLGLSDYMDKLLNYRAADTVTKKDMQVACRLC